MQHTYSTTFLLKSKEVYYPKLDINFGHYCTYSIWVIQMLVGCRSPQPPVTAMVRRWGPSMNVCGRLLAIGRCHYEFSGTRIPEVWSTEAPLWIIFGQILKGWLYTTAGRTKTRQSLQIPQALFQGPTPMFLQPRAHLLYIFLISGQLNVWNDAGSSTMTWRIAHEQTNSLRAITVHYKIPP